MKLITSESVKDFQTCALLYDYRHSQKMPESISARDILSIRFENTLKEIIFYSTLILLQTVNVMLLQRK